MSRVAKALDAVQIVLCDPHYWGGMRNVQQLVAPDVGAGHGPLDALQQSPGRQHDGDDARRGGLSESDLRLRYALSLADREGRGRGRRPRPVRRRLRAASRISPGLGVDLDYDQLARGRERYAKIPYPQARRRGGNGKHVDPNWERILPRW